MMGNSGSRTLLPLLMLLAMVVPLYPQFAGGSGTEDDPYLVDTATHLHNVQNYRTCHFLQTADIDLNVPPYNQGIGWIPMCSSSYYPFTGVYDGAGHLISNLYINTEYSGAGLFGNASGALLKNIRLELANVSSSSIKLGILLGIGVNTTIENCLATGWLSGFSEMGGLVGRISSCNLSFCRTNCRVELESSYGGNLVGWAENSTITSCSSSGSIDDRWGNYGKGGFIGYTQNTTITNCHSDTSIDGATYSAGFVSHMIGGTISNCYYSGTALEPGDPGCGFAASANSSTIINCYWNTETSQTSTSSGGYGRNTDEMTYPYATNTYENWDFTNVWAADSVRTQNGGYPYLRGFPDTGIVANPLFSHHSGYYPSAILLTISSYTPGVTIHYTLDGSEPDANSPVYSTPLSIEGTVIVKAYASRENWLSSMTVSAHYSAQYFSGGSGTSGDPYLVSCPDDLQCVRYFMDAYFRQVTDIDMNVAPFNSGMGWEPIGSWNDITDVFSGRYDGNGFQIANLFINRTEGFVGLFGVVFEAELIGINLSNVNISGGWDAVGGLAGDCSDSIISKCSVSGVVNGSYDVGGLFGGESGGSEISDCYSRATVVAGHYAGGLVAWMGSSLLENCYSTGHLSTQYEHWKGGLIAIINGNITLNNSYWDVQTSGTWISAGGEGRTTDEMTYPYAANTYVNWHPGTWWPDIEYINSGYPYLNFYRTVAMPYIQAGTPVPGLPVSVSMQCDTWGAEIYYSLDGSDPDESSQFYQGPFQVEADEDSIVIVRARAYRQGFTPSSISEHLLNWSSVYSWPDTQVIPASVCKVYPNPFNPETTISFSLMGPEKVKLGVLNSRGQKVITLADGAYPSGEHRVIWDGKDASGIALGSGLYYYRLETGKHHLMGKMILLK